MNTAPSQLSAETIRHAADRAARNIPPAWPLAATVAVNPYLGQSDQTLSMVGPRLARVAGIPVTMPRPWFADKISTGALTDADIQAAMMNVPTAQRPKTVADVKAAAKADTPAPTPLPTVADLASTPGKSDWPGLIAERFGAWAAAQFDDGQALWAAPKAKSVFEAWRAFAMHDLTPEIHGVTQFAQQVADGPDEPLAAIEQALNHLKLDEAALETYFHTLLASLGGWAYYARYRLWQAELKGEKDETIIDFLAIRLVWEQVLYNLYEKDIENSWAETRTAHADPVAPTPDSIIDEILQEALERAKQRDFASLLAEPGSIVDGRPTLQAAFCIDVRSEIFRRSLESLSPAIRTIGFAGFFGLATSHRGFASDVEEARLPVLLAPGVHSRSGGEDNMAADRERRFAHRAKRAWGRFKLAAVSSFAFVEATGPLYMAKLVRDALGLAARDTTIEPAPRLDPALDLPQRLSAAEAVLRAMSLTETFAPVVLLVGHGANVVNNPHASALHCGACGGYSGEVNARLLAALLNDSDVRTGLKEKGIDIPDDTLFLAALHDTTGDDVTLYADDHPSPAHGKTLTQVRGWLTDAGRLTRSERAQRLPRADAGNDVAYRSRDWSETRPEWALAGCMAFIAAPRSRTAGKKLDGRAFLHDYDWQKDAGFSVLELIMTAPVVVSSWISLQYYGSTTAPHAFGGGNKLLHNVTGGIGVVEGNGGLLKAGLPWQSVHDGKDLMHEPLRLSVCIEAPTAAMTDILERHPKVRALFDNRWLHLFALNAEGHMAERYVGDLDWAPV